MNLDPSFPKLIFDTRLANILRSFISFRESLVHRITKFDCIEELNTLNIQFSKNRGTHIQGYFVRFADACPSQQCSKYRQCHHY